uniref:protein FAM236A-like n=1 Tax=Jaculus jaculus TaxID=51337 RepID=UPI001E1B574A|nr:protein FAM236A-like [Jaculus jaculus]
MIFTPFFPPPQLTFRDLQEESEEGDIIFPGIMGNPSGGPGWLVPPFPPRRSWKSRFQRVLARVTKFFRRRFQMFQN